MGQATFAVKRDQLQAVMERVFDAPRETVFKAFVDPGAIPKWWGPRRLTTTVEKLEMKVWGVWRFIQRDPQGNEYAFHAVCTAIDPPKLLSSTFNFEGIPGDHEVLSGAQRQDTARRSGVCETTLALHLSVWGQSLFGRLRVPGTFLGTLFVGQVPAGGEVCVS